MTLSRPFGVCVIQERIDPVECFCCPKRDLRDSANAVVGLPPDFLCSLVAPVQFMRLSVKKAAYGSRPVQRTGNPGRPIVSAQVRFGEPGAPVLFPLTLL
jgi:hypothetical protein